MFQHEPAESSDALQKFLEANTDLWTGMEGGVLDIALQVLRKGGAGRPSPRRIVVDRRRLLRLIMGKIWLPRDYQRALRDDALDTPRYQWWAGTGRAKPRRG